MNRLYKILISVGIIGIAISALFAFPSPSDRAEDTISGTLGISDVTKIQPSVHVVETKAVKDVPKDTSEIIVATTTTLYTIPVTTEGSVVTAMNSFASSSRSFSFKGKIYPELGFFIEEIGGTRNSGGFYWTLYVNNIYSNTGASTHMVYPGDSIEWRYEKL